MFLMSSCMKNHNMKYENKYVERNLNYEKYYVNLAISFLKQPRKSLVSHYTI